MATVDAQLKIRDTIGNLQDVQSAADNVSLKVADEAGNVLLTAIRDAVDTLETLAAAIRDRLPSGGAATEMTLGTRATEATLAAVNGAVDQVESKLDSLIGKDFATQATLALVKARADLLATEATLAQIKDQSSQFARVLKFEPAAGEEIRRDETPSDDYHGVAPDGTATSSAVWFVTRFYKTAGLIVRVRAKANIAWDDRANALNWP